MDSDRSLRQHLVDLLDSASAHLTFDDAVKGFPAKLRGIRPPGAPHSAWELLEHIRIAQWDILEFTRDPAHVSPAWPSGYWPDTPVPPNPQAWNESIKAYRADRRALVGIAKDRAIDLHGRIPHGDGQTVLRELLLVADHNAYHLGQLVTVRRMVEGGDGERRP